MASLLVANTVTGAASLFRRELLDLALPFPPRHGTPYHDHWLAAVALASGRIAYVDRPLYDYVQHRDAALGHARANAVGRIHAQRARLQTLACAAPLDGGGLAGPLLLGGLPPAPVRDRARAAGAATG